MAERMSLHGSGPRGREEWRDLVVSLPHATATWADLEGMHCAPLPEAMPIGATHLWFWDTGCYGRVRIDGEQWIAGVLTEPGVSVPAHCAALREDAVEVDQVMLKAWAADDQRIWQFRGDPEVLAGFVQLVPRRQATGVFLAAAGQRV
ncbi:MAG: hypothetical protein ACRDRX_00490 [Pseudonocardiaceae bacterium]